MNNVSPLRFNGDRLTVQESQAFQFGDLHLRLTRGGGEWRLQYDYGTRTQANSWLPNGEAERQRLVVNASKPALQLGLRLADRPIVSRPLEKLALSPGARTTLHLHTTLWLCLYYEDAVLLELPAIPLSDIWFGPNSREGQLAYTDTTPTDLLWDADYNEEHKAVTIITVKNRSEEKLSLEKINIPVPELTLFRIGERHQSDGIDITIDKNQHANLVIAPGDGKANNAVRLSDARKAVSRGALTRAVNALFA